MTLDLSRKRRHTFAQTASLLQCNIEDLHYYVIEGELSPSIFISGKPLRTYLMVAGEHYETTGQVIPEELTSNNENDFGVPQIFYQRGFFHLILGRQISATDCEFQFVATKPSDFDLGDVVFKLDAPIRIAEISSTCEVMATELNRFKVMMSGSANRLIGEKPLSTSERNTLLKLVIGMAIKGYSHDPASLKSRATKEIADDLASLEIDLDPDTVRKYLKQAAETVLAGKRP